MDFFVFVQLQHIPVMYIYIETIIHNKELYITDFENFVLMMPGAMQLTRIPSPARSLAAALVSPIKAVLLTEYAPSN